MYTALSQVSQNTVVFNEKPSRKLWDTICTTMCSLPFCLSQIINLIVQKNYLTSRAAFHGERQLQLRGRSLEVSQNLLASLRVQTQAFLLVHNYPMNRISFTFLFVFSKFQHNTLSSSVFAHFKDFKGPPGTLLCCCPM